MPVARWFGLSLLAMGLLLSVPAGACQAEVAHASAPPGCEGIDEQAGQGCDVSFVQLLADPRAYDQRRVYVIGYLVSDFGDLFLYPDKSSYEGGKDMESLALMRPIRLPKVVLRDVGRGVYPVAVLGRFEARAALPGMVVPRLGAITEIMKIMPVPRIPSGAKLDMHGIEVIP